MNVLEAPLATTEWSEIADAALAGEVSPARVFKSRIGDRHTPQMPFMERLGQPMHIETVTETPPGHLLDRDPAVAALVEQGLWVERVGARGWACPDYLVVTSTRKVVAVEVKTHRSFAGLGTRRRLAQVGAACLRLGIGYEVWCELTADQKSMYDRLFTLGRDPLDPEPRTAILEQEIVEAAHVPSPFATLRAQVDATGADFLPAFWRLCWKGRLCIDWDEPFTDGSTVRAHGPNCPNVGRRTAKWSGVCGPALEAHQYTRRGFSR